MYFKIVFILLLNLIITGYGNTSESTPIKENIDEIINIGEMLSHNKKFVLYFKSRAKPILAKGKEANYIKDFPQDLYSYDISSKKQTPLITHEWFPKEVKKYLNSGNIPIFPEDFAYYLLEDNQTIIMISGVKAINVNFQFDIKNKKLEILSDSNDYKLMISSLLKKCGYFSLKSKYDCSYYKPLISINLIH